MNAHDKRIGPFVYGPRRDLAGLLHPCEPHEADCWSIYCGLGDSPAWVLDEPTEQAAVDLIHRAGGAVA